MMMARSCNQLKTVWALRDLLMAGVPSAKHHVMAGPKQVNGTSLSLLPLVTKEEQLAWAERIKPHVPQCATMHNNLVQHGRGHVSHDNFYVLHGCPSSHVVICDKKIAPAIQHTGVFCLEDEVDEVIDVLGLAPHILDWRRPNLVIHHVPSYLTGPLQRLAEENGVKMDREECLGFSYEPHLDTKPLRVGPGFRVCMLGRAGVRRLVEKAEYGDGMSLEVVYNLAQRLPYVGVYVDAAMTQDTRVDVANLPVAGDDEVPIVWLCSTPRGDVGMLMVEEGFRRHGFGSLVSTVMARLQSSLLGFIPHSFHKDGNFSSVSMAANNAGWSHTHDVSWLSSVSSHSRNELKD